MVLSRLFGSGSKSGARGRAGGKASGLGATYRRLLTPVDMRHADQSEKAIGAAAEIARAVDGEFYILTVRYPLGDEVTDFPEMHESEFNAFVEAKAAETGVAITPVFRSHESATKTIHEASEEFGVDLIVMASHDPRIADYVFSSKASDVALHSRCSVLVVR